MRKIHAVGGLEGEADRTIRLDEQRRETIIGMLLSARTEAEALGALAQAKSWVSEHSRDGFDWPIAQACETARMMLPDED